MDELAKQYRYSRKYSGVNGEGLTILPVGNDPLKQNIFNAEIQLITISLFGEGYAANPIYTSYPPVVFQSSDQQVNHERAREVSRKWRELKRQGIDILKEYYKYSPAYKTLREIYRR